MATPFQVPSKLFHGGGRTGDAQGKNAQALQDSEASAEYKSNMREKGRRQAIGWVCCACQGCFKGERVGSVTNCGHFHRATPTPDCSNCFNVRIFTDKNLCTVEDNFIPFPTGATGWYHNINGCRRHHVGMDTPKNCTCGVQVNNDYEYTCRVWRV